MPSETFRRILVVNPYGIGDVLFTTALLSNLRRSFPKAFIGVLLGSRTKEVLENNPDIDEIYVFDKGKFDRLPKVEALKMLFSLIKKLRSRRFELLLDLSNSSQYGFIEKFFLNIPKRVGFNYRNRGKFLTDKIELRGYKDKHVVEYYLDLTRYLGINPEDKSLKLPLKEEDLIWAKGFLEKNNIASCDLIIGIIPGGGSSWGKDALYKHWAKENFARVSDKLTKDLNAKIIIMGDEDEQKLCEIVINSIDRKQVSACSKTTLGQFAALCGLCNLVICNDGGPLHIAVSQDTPTISIFGPVDDKVYGPFSTKVKNYVVKKQLSCQPCYQDFKLKPCLQRKCLDLITVDDVFRMTKIALENK